MSKFADVLRAGYAPLPSVSGESLPEVVERAMSWSVEHLSTSPAVRAYLTELSKGPGTSCPDSRIEELVRYISTQRGSIDKSDPHVNVAFMQRCVAPALAFEREVVCGAACRAKDTTPFERKMLRLSIKLGAALDALWTRWFMHVAAPYQALSETEQGRYTERATGLLAPYDYTVAAYDAEHGFGKRRAWAEAFPREIARVRTWLHHMRDAAQSAGEEQYVAYFNTCAEAYTCTRIEELESGWTAVDLAWVRIPSTSRLVPVHGMESVYEHPFGVSPEFRLEVRTDYGAEEISARRAGTAAYARTLGLGVALIEVLDHQLKQVDVGVFLPAVRAGVAQNFRIAGQAVPNRHEAAAAGSRIFVDRANITLARGDLVQYFDAHMAPNENARLREHLSVPGMLRHVLNHEYAHPIGRTDESDLALGAVLGSMEEAKASLLGLLADDARMSADSVYRVELATLTVARVLRFFYRDRMQNPALAAYVRENVATARTLFDTGVIELTPRGLRLDEEALASGAWFTALRELCLRIIHAYEAHDREALKQVTAEYCDLDYPPVRALIQWVNRPAE